MDIKAEVKRAINVNGECSPEEQWGPKREKMGAQ